MKKLPHKLKNIINANLSRIDAITLDSDDKNTAQFFFVDELGNNVFENTEMPLKKYGFHFYREESKDQNSFRFYLPTVDEHFISLVLPKNQPYKVKKADLPKNVANMNREVLKTIVSFSVFNSINLERTVAEKLSKQNAKIGTPSTTSGSRKIN